MRIKAIFNKNLRMPPEKMASQIAHAVANLGIPTPKDRVIIVLGMSTNKMAEKVIELRKPDAPLHGFQIDAGITVVPEGTLTAIAWIEEKNIKS